MDWDKLFSKLSDEELELARVSLDELESMGYEGMTRALFYTEKEQEERDRESGCKLRCKFEQARAESYYAKILHEEEEL